MTIVLKWRIYIRLRVDGKQRRIPVGHLTKRKLISTNMYNIHLDNGIIKREQNGDIVKLYPQIPVKRRLYTLYIRVISPLDNKYKWKPVGKYDFKLGIPYANTKNLDRCTKGKR